MGAFRRSCRAIGFDLRTIVAEEHRGRAAPLESTTRSVP
jgi:hypothetical protein